MNQSTHIENEESNYPTDDHKDRNKIKYIVHYFSTND